MKPAAAERPPPPRRAWQWDLARQSERPEWLEAQLPRYADWGYNELYLHLEDAVVYPSLPGVARRGAYSHRRLARLVEAAGRYGISVVPIVNLLGHTQYLIQSPAWRDLNELRAPDGSPLPRGQLCPLHPRTLELAEKLLHDTAPFCTAGVVHVGLDESYALGRHPLSRAEIAEVGLAAHFARYAGRLRDLAHGLGLRLGLWADMLALLPEAVAMLPPDVVAYDWYYYPFRRKPRVEAYNFAEYDLAPSLRARGITYWGCPMNGAFRHEPLPIFRERLANISAWWRRCGQTGAAGMLITSWEPQRLAVELAMTVDAAAAGLWLDGEFDPARLLEAGCLRMFGANGRAAARRLERADELPFSGTARWRINDRWDTALTDEPLEPWRREARVFRDLSPKTGLPPPVASSLRFRAYLAERDLFVRTAGRGMWRLRRAQARGDKGEFNSIVSRLTRAAAAFAGALGRGRAAARAMWLRTRDRRAIGPNEKTVAEDAARLAAWRAWLRRCSFRAARVRSASPLGGAWQFVFTVKNPAPALQKVAVEQQDSSGRWRELWGLFLIEFRVRGARSRARLTYRLSAPVEWQGPPAKPPRLRVVVRGLGRVALSDALLTDGVVRLAANSEEADSVAIGHEAPRSGFPDFDWERNRGAWEPNLTGP
jgi:Glycosyl hydrolase family 20, catalytic domain